MKAALEANSTLDFFAGFPFHATTKVTFGSVVQTATDSSASSARPAR